MKHILVGRKTVPLSELDWPKLRLLLPYWGLSIDAKNQIIERFSDQIINVSGLDEKLRKDINAFLAHSGLNVNTVPSDHAQMTVTFSENASAPLSIQISNLTYRYHPNKNHFYKGIWLVNQSDIPRVKIHIAEREHCSEWLAYLLLQLAEPGRDRAPLGRLAPTDYQRFASEILKVINPKFAACFWDEATDREAWPLQPGTHSGTSTYDVGPSHFNPFKKGASVDEKPQPINPFRRKKPEISIIHPFKNNRTQK
ncbi:hypothetical protein ACFO4N_15640 [Camelliibacillus cellulosilyticus]|uniref:Uncharacterized protein n=1 Tax=Camelliibacillus cellulosilyticus TaxID=2174486 RepID=A0ABV9GTC1_9BACL